MKSFHDPNGAIRPEELPVRKRIAMWLALIVILATLAWVNVQLGT